MFRQNHRKDNRQPLVPEKRSKRVNEFYVKGNEGWLPRGNHISAIADLDGDGLMEVVLYSAYHEGSASDVVQLKGSKATGVLGCACEL